MDRLTVVKIGGNVLDDAAALERFRADFAALPGHRILVHGGGKIATRIGERLGIGAIYHEGRRITDRDTLELVIMVYGGLVNKQLVAGLQGEGCNAIGLTGADGAILPAIRRPVAAVDYGFVGDLLAEEINTAVLKALLDAGLTPVCAPLSYDGLGGLLNTNADTIARSLAVALSQEYAVSLVYCFERAGVLQDPADDSTLIPAIDAATFEELKRSGVIRDGMIPKVDNALGAVASGVKEVIIGPAARIQDLVVGAGGTRIA